MVRTALLAMLTAMALAVPGAAVALAQTDAAIGQEGGCASSTEPDDGPDQAGRIAGRACFEGTLPAGDQDLVVWEVSAGPARGTWTMELEGVPGARTVSDLRPVISAAGVMPLQVGGPILVLTVEQGSTESAVASDILLTPGRYLVGVSAGGQADDPSAPDLALAYRVSLEHGAELPPTGDVEPNDDATVATAVQGAFSLSGDLAGSTDMYRWTVPDGELAAWTLRALTQLGASGQLTLASGDGSEILVRAPSTDGRVELHDLALTPGDYIVTIEPAASAPTPYGLSAEPVMGSSGDLEPNDTADRAQPMLGDKPLAKGRLGRIQDEDWYRLDVTESLAAGTVDIRLLWRSGLSRELCLTSPAGETLLCRTAEGGLNISGLSLPPGEHWLRVRGEAAPDDPYLLRVDPAGTVSPDFEREPNDDPATATMMGTDSLLRGRALGADVDHAQVRVTGDPQLWKVDARGAGITGLDWIRPNGERLAAAAVGPAGDAASLTDLYLVPGEHWLRVAAKDGEYTLELTPLGPPDPNAEREPNDLPAREERLLVGRQRTGRLPAGTDVDVFGFSVRGPDHLLLAVTPPAGGDIDVMVTDGISLSRRTQATGGRPLREELLLGPGEYRVALQAMVPSEEPYTISLERLDPVWPSGHGPAGDASRGSDLGLEIVWSSGSVAAWWPAGQRLTGVARLTNGGAKDLEVSIDAAASDASWHVHPAQPLTSVPAGGKAEVPLEVAVPVDVPGDAPVRISFRASSADGQSDTASTDFEPAGDVAASAPLRSWRVPEALLGGLDVASESLGAVPIVSLDAGQEARIHDGFAAPDWGLSWPIGGLPVSLTVDLAGDEPVPVAGTLLHPLSEDPSLGDAVRDFELALSLDGASWETVVTGRLEPVAEEQAFVLAAPVEARYAQFRVSSLQRELPSRLDLGEWKVVATPGWSPPGGLLDLADPRAGGHVVRMTPQPEPVELTGSLLDAGTAPAALAVEPRTAVDWVIGFMEDRAALISTVEWHDPVPSDAAARLDRVELAGSLESPLGPWQPLGRWELARAADGSVTPLALETPSWVRFIRVSGSAGRRQERVELPDRLRVLEAQQGAGYRSVIGQWGMGEPAGPYEWSTPSDEPGIDELADSDGPDEPGVLDAGTPVRGRVHFDEDADWYRVTVPGDMRSVALTVRGRASVGVALVLRAEDGSEVPMTFSPGEASGSVTYQAPVAPGATYLVEVQQPPSSVVVAFDTSASVVTELAAIESGLRRLAEGISDDREALLILPFDGEPLLPTWSSDGYEVADAVNRYQLGPSSSAVEANLRQAALELGARDGGRAVLIVTDGASSSPQETERLWATLSSVRPQVFTVEVGGEGERPAIARHHLLADLAASSAGFASQARGPADILEAFDRLATWLRRPVAYSLSYEASPEELPPPEPGRLAVLSPEHEGVRPAVLASDTAIELVVDTSGSMRKRLGDLTRIDIAKDVLTGLVRDDLPVGAQVALRQFPPQSDPCGSVLLTPLGPLEPASAVGTIAALAAPKDARTPLARAIAAVADDLVGGTGRRIVVVVSDGKESCKGDPEAEVRRLREQGLDVTLHVVGLALDRASRKTIAQLADVGGGTYFDAGDAETLGAALRAAVSAPFEVVDGSGAVVARGTVGGDPLALPMGRYRVTVATEPPVTFDDVLVQPEVDVVLTLASTD